MTAFAFFLSSIIFFLAFLGSSIHEDKFLLLLVISSKALKLSLYPFNIQCTKLFIINLPVISLFTLSILV